MFPVICRNSAEVNVITGVKPLIVTAVTINPIWRTQKEVKSIFYFICFIVVIIKTLSMKE